MARPQHPEHRHEDAGETETIDPLSVNAACYVCHTTFVRKEISKVHFGEKGTCIECHGRHKIERPEDAP